MSVVGRVRRRCYRLRYRIAWIGGVEEEKVEVPHGRDESRAASRASARAPRRDE